MPPRCTQCESVTIKKLSLIYEGGVRKRTSNTVRVSRSKRSTTSYSTTSSTSKTALAEKYSPPSSASSSEVIAICLVIGVIGFFFYAPILPLALLICVASFKKAYNYNTNVYPYVYQKWDCSYMCQRCGNVFMPFSDEYITTEPEEPKSFFIWYILVLVTLPVAFVYQYTKPEHNNQESAATATPMAAVLPANPTTKDDSQDDIAKLAKDHEAPVSEIQSDQTPTAIPTNIKDNDIQNAGNVAAGSDQNQIVQAPSETVPLYPPSNTPPPEAINPLNDTRPVHRADVSN